MVDKYKKKGLHYHKKKPKKTVYEQESLPLLKEVFLTSKQIELRRGCTRQAVNKIIKNLKKKGAYNLGLHMVDKVRPTCQPNHIRLHAQEWNIKLLWQDENYKKLLQKSNILFIDSNTIRLYRNSIEIYSGQSFLGKDEQIATINSLIYWKGFFARLEHELKTILVKPKARNIKLVNQHYAYENSEICKNAIDEGEKIQVFAEEDGKLAFITDDSFGFKEDETLHPVTAKHDRKRIDKQVNDWRINNPPTNSEIVRNQEIFSRGMIQVSNVMQGIQQNQEVFAKNMASHIKAIQELGSGVKKMSSLMGKTLRENKDLKLKLNKQTTLGDFE